MPIRINLLAEAQSAEDLRRRDPVKRGIWIGGFCVALALLWCGKLQLDIWREAITRTRMEQDWTSLEPKNKALVQKQERANRLSNYLTNLDRYSTNRFLWANALNALQHSIVDDIQVTHVRGEQAYEITSPENATNTLANGTTSVTHKPGTSTERVRLSIDARDFKNQDQQWTKFKEALSSNDYFKRHLKTNESFVLEGTQSSPLRDPGDPTHEYVTFSLVAKLPEVKRYE
jgi:hypothetical protein